MANFQVSAVVHTQEYCFNFGRLNLNIQGLNTTVVVIWDWQSSTVLEQI